jgi:hypothetical protein
MRNAGCANAASARGMAFPLAVDGLSHGEPTRPRPRRLPVFTIVCRTVVMSQKVTTYATSESQHFCDRLQLLVSD